jgi:hypothetical protein
MCRRADAEPFFYSRLVILSVGMGSPELNPGVPFNSPTAYCG